MSNSFSKSIGHNASRGINMNSVGIGQASGGPVGSYSFPRKGTATGTSTLGAANREPPRPKPPLERHNEASSIKAAGGRNSQGTSIKAPSNTDRLGMGKVK